MRNKKTIIILTVIALALLLTTTFSSSIAIRTERQDDRSNPIDNKYAVIFVGRYFGALYQWTNLSWIQQYYTWYLNDAAKMYLMLRDTYEYSEDNIFLLVRLLPDNIPNPDGDSYFQVPDIFDTSWIDYTASEENLEMVLNKFKPGGEKELTLDDSLYVTIIDHGGNYGGGGINWLTPYQGIDTAWENEANAFDNDLDTKAKYDYPNDGWSAPLKLALASPTSVKGFRINANNREKFDKLKLEFYNNDILVLGPIEFSGWPEDSWKNYRFDDCIVDEVRIKFHENDPVFGFGILKAFVNEFDFWPSSEPDDFINSYFGCPFNSIPAALLTIFGIDVEKLHDYELANYVSEINANIIYVLQPCCSGGFIDDLSGPNRIICTSCRGSQTADGWIGAFREALNEDVYADYDNNGYISIQEAYEYSALYVIDYIDTHDGCKEYNPLIDDNSDEIGHHVTETGYNPDLPGFDGYIADATYLNNVEVLDIEQLMSDRGLPIRYAADGSWSGAQSFTPTVDKITKAEIYIRKFGYIDPEFDLVVELRTDDPQGNLIDTLTFIPEEISSSWEWITLDFSDVTVTSGTEYFIVCQPAPSGVTTSFGYEWGFAFGNQYDDGAFWFTRDGGGLWRDLPTSYEFTFKTYGY